MSIKIQSLIFVLFCSSADAMDYYKISNNGLYSYNGELLNQEIAAGKHSIDFNAKELTSGIYFYEIRTKSFFNVKKMVLVK